MASVNFEKIKTPQEVKAMLRHCDQEERLEHEHSNQQIDKTLTGRNEQLYSYANSCRLYDTRIAELDAVPGANVRKDRVTCFGLCIPAPEELPERDMPDWSASVLNIIQEQYGEQNMIGAYVHFDEVHDYKDAETGKDRTSRPHIHVYMVPEVNGKLNGKAFSSKSNMLKLNRSIHEMTKADYSLDFMDGTKRKSKKEVETLKEESRLQELNNREKELALLLKQNQQLQTTLKARESILEDKLEECKGIYEKLSERAKKDVKGSYERMVGMRDKEDQEEVQKDDIATIDDILTYKGY